MSASQADGERPKDPYAGRRQLDSLTVKDLRATPAWWFPGRDGHLSGPDEGTVLPLEADAAHADGSVEFPSGSRYLLHAQIEFADGSKGDGHVSYEPGDRGDLPDREPTLCSPTRQIPLWHGIIEPDARAIAADLTALGRTRAQVFPLYWRTTLHPPGVELSGTADGFAVFNKGVVRFL